MAHRSAFAKMGINPLTCRLVRAERDALARLDKAGLAEITLPRVLHHDQWHGLDVLVLSALPAWAAPPSAPPARLAAAMNEVARVGGLRREPLPAARTCDGCATGSRPPTRVPSRPR